MLMFSLHFGLQRIYSLYKAKVREVMEGLRLSTLMESRVWGKEDWRGKTNSVCVSQPQACFSWAIWLLPVVGIVYFGFTFESWDCQRDSVLDIEKTLGKFPREEDPKQSCYETSPAGWPQLMVQDGISGSGNQKCNPTLGTQAWTMLFVSPLRHWCWMNLDVSVGTRMGKNSMKGEKSSSFLARWSEILPELIMSLLRPSGLPSFSPSHSLLLCVLLVLSISDSATNSVRHC